MNELIEIEKDLKMPSRLKMSSFGSYWFWYQFATLIFDAWVFYFYEVVLHLDVWLIAGAMWIFIVWDALNEPIIGYLTDRNTKFTRKWGKRFPWIIAGSFIGILTFMMIFMPPNVNAQTNPFPIFIWLIISTCLYDTTLTVSAIHANALFVDTFRSDGARRKAQSWIAPISLLALPIGAMIPSFVIEFETRGSFLELGIISGIILFVSALLLIYGVREDKETIDRYYEVKEKPQKFITSLKSTFKQRSFMIYALFFFGYFLVVLSIQASLPYVVIFIIAGPPEDIGMNITLIMAGLIIGALISIPVWTKLTKKLNNNKKAIIIGSVILIVASFVVALFVELITLIIFTAFFGFAMGAFWYLDSIVLADVLDERSAKLKSDQKGATLGVREFIARLPRAIQVLMFALIHTLTGFDVDPFNSAAQIGIRLHMTIIPAFIFIVFVVIFWKYYPLTTEKLVKIKAELKELGI